MNRDEAKQLLPIIQAFAEGKTVQCRQGISDAWEDLIGNVNFLLHAHNYRIKPEPRPWKFTEVPRYFIISEKKLDAPGRYRVAARCTAESDTPIVIISPETSHRYISLRDAFDYYDVVSADGAKHICGVLEAQP